MPNLNMENPKYPTNWQCRVCGYDRFFRVVVPRPNNKTYATQFFDCSKCQVMFFNPASFNALNDKPVVDVLPSREFRIKAVK
jgi:hypothetical protein